MKNKDTMTTEELSDAYYTNPTKKLAEKQWLSKEFVLKCVDECLHINKIDANNIYTKDAKPKLADSLRIANALKQVHRDIKQKLEQQ